MPALHVASRVVARPRSSAIPDRAVAFSLRGRDKQSSPRKEDVARQIRENLACGAIARFAQNSSMYPIDTIKTRIQVSRTVEAVGAAHAGSRFRSAIAKGGLYRGLPLSLVGNVPYGMITFGLYETIKSELFEKRWRHVPKLLAIVASACIGDAIGSLALTPAEVVKSKTQAGLYKSSADAVRAIANRGGLPGFYQGYGAALSRDLPFRAIQLTLYENVRQHYSSWVKRRHSREVTAVENLLMGAVTGSTTAAFTTPLDVIRTRMMSQSPGTGAAYSSALDCMVKSVKAEGFRSLYKGIVPRVGLIGPSTAIFFVSYEAAKSFFRNRQQKLDLRSTTS